MCTICSPLVHTALCSVVVMLCMICHHKIVLTKSRSHWCLDYNRVCTAGPCLNGGECVTDLDFGPHGENAQLQDGAVRGHCRCMTGYDGAACEVRVPTAATLYARCLSFVRVAQPLANTGDPAVRSMRSSISTSATRALAGTECAWTSRADSPVCATILGTTTYFCSLGCVALQHGCLARAAMPFPFVGCTNCVFHGVPRLFRGGDLCDIRQGTKRRAAGGRTQPVGKSITRGFVGDWQQKHYAEFGDQEAHYASIGAWHGQAPRSRGRHSSQAPYAFEDDEDDAVPYMAAASYDKGIKLFETNDFEGESLLSS